MINSAPMSTHSWRYIMRTQITEPEYIHLSVEVTK